MEILGNNDLEVMFISSKKVVKFCSLNLNISFQTLVMFLVWNSILKVSGLIIVYGLLSSEPKAFYSDRARQNIKSDRGKLRQETKVKWKIIS